MTYDELEKLILSKSSLGAGYVAIRPTVGDDGELTTEQVIVLDIEMRLIDFFALCRVVALEDREAQGIGRPLCVGDQLDLEWADETVTRYFGVMDDDGQLVWRTQDDAQ